MSNDLTQLRQRVDRLERRVGELERLLDAQDETPADGQRDGLDTRDAAVVAVLEHGETYTRRDVSQAYLRETEIRDSDTAAERANGLLDRDFFQRANSGYTYRG
jgi:hypothetical protein